MFDRAIRGDQVACDKYTVVLYKHGDQCMRPRPVLKSIAAARAWARVPGRCIVARSRVFSACSARRSGALHSAGSQAMSIEDAKKAAG